MDTNKQYIKMCERAQEIQKYYQKEHKVNISLGDWVYQYTIKSIKTVPNKYLPEVGFWVPRQDQLQEMVYHEEWDGLELYTFVEFSAYVIKYYKCGTLEQLWLAFVMKEKYNKIWNNEKEEWKLI